MNYNAQKEKSKINSYWLYRIWYLRRLKKARKTSAKIVYV
jgi:hypothetical protein